MSYDLCYLHLFMVLDVLNKTDQPKPVFLS